MTPIEALEEAIKYLGNSTSLAKAIGCDKSMIPYWRKVAKTRPINKDLVSAKLSRRIERETDDYVKAKWLAPETFEYYGR